MVAEAFSAVHRNKDAVAMYMAVSIGIMAAQGATGHFLSDSVRKEMAPVYASAYDFGLDLLIALAYAIVQCIAFARIARDIDRPLWKVDSGAESLRRFFKLWFILMLVSVTMIEVTERAAELKIAPLASLLSSCWLLIYLFMIPFGACVMFYGKVGREELRLAADTLVHQFPRTLIVLFIAFAVLIVIEVVQVFANLPVWAKPAIGILDGYGDCLIFSTAWLLCMYNRDEDMGDSDIDF